MYWLHFYIHSWNKTIAEFILKWNKEKLVRLIDDIKVYIIYVLEHKYEPPLIDWNYHNWDYEIEVEMVKTN